MYGVVFALWVVTVLVLFLAAFNVYLAFLYKRVCLEKNRYQLYAVRDTFVRLVAEGHLEEKDEVFQHYYHAVNSLIPQTKHITLRTFLKGLKRIDPKVREAHNKMMEKVEQKNDEVKKAVMTFYETIVRILCSNSLVLKVSIALALVSIFAWVSIKFASLLSIRVFSTVGTKIRCLLQSVFPSMSYYQEYEAMKANIAI